MFRRIIFAFIIALPGIAMLTPAANAVLPRYLAYRILDADSMYYDQGSGAWFSYMNNSYQIFTSGSSSQTGHFNRLWDNGYAAPYAYDDQAFTFVSRGWKINEYGETAGELIYTDDRQHQHAYVTIGKTVTELPPLNEAHYLNPDLANQPTCGGAWAYDVNENGDVSGWSAKYENGMLKYRAVVWQGGVPFEYPAVTGYEPDSMTFEEVFINNSGQIAGNFKTTDAVHNNIRKGFYGDGDGLMEVEPFTASPIYTGGVDAKIYDMNDSGQVVGSFRINVGGTETTHAAIYDITTGNLKDLHSTHFAGNNSIGSVAVGINNKGQVVGYYTSGGAPQSAFLYDPVEDSTFIINQILLDYLWHDELGAQTVPGIQSVYDINDQGAILGRAVISGIPRIVMYTPVQGNLVVNSTGDANDISPGDGKCYTGGRNELGLDECTMRAAIEEVNAFAGRDTITFDIPSGAPSIKLSDPLPSLSEEVVIDAITQPTSHRVEISGELLASGNGLIISPGNCELYGLMLNSFPGYGLIISANGENIVESSHFGTDITGTLDWGNAAGGIFIDISSGNRIGDQASFEQGNLIAFNGGPGVTVNSGDSNLIARNYIYNNDGLGIDLAPIGVNSNDTLDADVGPNTLLNYPEIDSVAGGLLYGTLMGAPNDAYIVELYLNDSCDASGYGEGQKPILTSLVNTDADGVVEFNMSTGGETLTDQQVFTLLSFDSDNTSEFSACWPHKNIIVSDFNGTPIPSMSFELYRVREGAPNFADSLIDTVTTDASGSVDLRDYYSSGALAEGAMVKLHRLMMTQATVRDNPNAVLPDAIEWHLDNAKFDSLSYDMSFDTLDNTGDQVILMNHTLVLLNMVVSIQWEAEDPFLNGLGQALRDVSNYLFDVSDGQMALGKVEIRDDMDEWHRADLQIVAKNNLRPEGSLGGIYLTGDKKMITCRSWYGNEGFGPDSSFNEYPLTFAGVDNVRVVAHEMGHYFLGLDDEYLFFRADRCSDAKLYGFMDVFYDLARPETSEMSQALDYNASACQNTNQWHRYGQSCWNTVDEYFTRSMDGVPLPIFRPDERNMPVNFNTYLGPNDDPANLNYDIGARLEVNTVVFPHASQTHTVNTAELISGIALPHKFAILIKPTKNNLRRYQHQGNTNHAGLLRVLGAETGDSLVVSGEHRLLNQKLSRALFAAGQYSWSSTRVALDVGVDSQIIEMAPVQGNFPMLCRTVPGASADVLELTALNMFSSPPDIVVATDSGSSAPIAMSAGANSYSGTLPDTLLQRGNIEVDAVDSTGAPFFFNIEYAAVDSNSAGIIGEVYSASQQFSTYIDSAQGNYARVMVSSTDYPVIASGLAAESQIASRAFALAAYPDVSFGESTMVAVSYDQTMIIDDPGLFSDEATIHLFKWNEIQSAWERLYSVDDTSLNIVMAAIDGPGMYVAATTDIIAAVGDIGDGSLPEQFELSQNYPNPFNPATTIKYNLAGRSHVTIEIYNVLGQKITTLVDKEQLAGEYEITWDGKDASGNAVASGIYFYRMATDRFTESKKMLLLK